MKRFFLFGFGFLSLCVTDAHSELTGSSHDLSALGTDSPCAYCHSVHNAVGGLGRPAYLGATLPDITLVYSSDTLDHPLDVTSVSNSDAPLCLSCHDGAFVQDKNADVFAAIDGTDKDLTTDLTNDHPVGFVFDASLDDEIVAPPVDSSIHVTFGPNKDEMWCSTCHDPHGGVPGTPLLQTDNTGSALCLTCHKK